MLTREEKIQEAKKAAEVYRNEAFASRDEGAIIDEDPDRHFDEKELIERYTGADASPEDLKALREFATLVGESSDNERG